MGTNEDAHDSLIAEEKDLIFSKQFHENSKEQYKNYLYFNVFLGLGIIVVSSLAYKYGKNNTNN
jgi:hypothetical protein